MTGCALLLCLAISGTAQQPRITDPQLPGRPTTPADRTFEEFEREAAKKRNKERQENLKRDSDKLLQLATELKEYVEKSNEHVLSLEVVKKAEEIEKLARSVRGKMKGE